MSSWILVGLLTSEPQWELLRELYDCFLYLKEQPAVQPLVCVQSFPPGPELVNVISFSSCLPQI